jgi:ABC-type lipoprotein release transport system permease subunit
MGIPMLAQLYVPWGTVGFGVCLAIVIGLAAGVVPAWRAATLPVVDGLRKVV